MREKIPLLIILLIASILRLFMLGEFPKGFSGDEAQQGYSAYSILKTGRDEWGDFLPISPRGFGDYKPPLYTYLTIPSVGILGLSKESVRLPAAFLGVLTVAVTYFLAGKLFNSKNIALWSSFLLAISPWHIQLSRTAFEAGSGVFFFSLGLLFYLKGISKNINLILTTLFFAFSAYAYHSFRLFVLLFLIGLTILKWKELPRIKYMLILLIIFLLPVIINFKASLSRASDVGITNPTEIKGYFENKGVSPLPYVLDRVIDNKVLFILSKGLDNYLSYFSAQFFFTGNRSDGSYLNFPGFSLLYPFEIIFWLSALFFLSTQRANNYQIILLWFLLAIIPASLAQGAMNAHRATTLLPLTAIISGLGVTKLIEVVSQRFTFFKINFYFLIIFCLSLSFLLFCHFYLIKLPQKPPISLRTEYEQIFKKILEVEKNYKEVIITKEFTEPQIFVAFYGQIDPITFQQASQDWLRYEKSDKLYVDQLESWNLGKFLFEGINWESKERSRTNALVVGKAEDFPTSVISIYDYKDQKGKIVYRLIPSIGDDK